MTWGLVGVDTTKGKHSVREFSSKIINCLAHNNNMLNVLQYLE